MRELRELDGREVVLSSLDKVLWPATGFTKRDMVDYYTRVAHALIPHLAQRPLTLGRFPEGVDGPGFAQTECRGRPEWLQTAALPLRSGVVRNWCLINDRSSLLWIVNLGTIEFHPILGTAQRPDQPRAVIFDLDPEPPVGIADCARVALALRDELARRGLAAAVKTSGAAGIHVLVPLNSPHSYERTKAFARELAERLAARHAGVVARASRRAGRAGTVLVDWAQNSERRTTVAPYSLRATQHPSVSTPLSWEEVERLDAGARFDPETVLARLERDGDRFAATLTTVQSL